MTFPSLRVQFAPDSTSPLQAPAEVHFPGVVGGAALGTTTTNAAFGAWDATLDIQVDLTLDDWTPAAEHSVFLRFVAGNSGSGGLWGLVRPDGKLRLVRRTGAGFLAYDSIEPIVGEPGERLVLRWTTEVVVIDATTYCRIGFFQDQPAHGPGAQGWRLLGFQHTTNLQTALDGAIQLQSTTAQAGNPSRLWGARFSTTLGLGGPIAGFYSQGYAAGATSVTDAFTGGVTWSGAPAAAAAAAPWVTIDARRIRSVDWSLGKRQEMGGPEATRATVVLANEDRLFDPEGPGIYASRLLPRVPVRIQVDPAGGASWVTQWSGFVEDGWEQSYAEPGEGECMVRCVDLIGVIAGVSLGRDRLSTAILRRGPAAYWPLDDISPDGGSADESGAGNDLTLSVGAQSGESVLPTRVGAALAVFRELATSVVAAVCAQQIGSFSCWFAVDPRNTTSLGRLLRVATTPGNADVLIVALGGHSGIYNGQVVVQWAGGQEVMTTAAHWDDGDPHHLVVSFEQNTTTIYVDGAVQALTTNTAGPTFQSSCSGVNRWELGGAGNASLSPEFGGTPRARLDEAVVFESLLPSGEVAALHQLGSQSLSRNVASAVGGAAEDVMLPSNLRSILGTYVSLASSAAYGRANVLGVMADYEALERGWLGVAHELEGSLQFRERGIRESATRSTVVQVAITDDAAASPSTAVRASSLTVAANGISTVVNVVSAVWPGGTEVVRDTASVARYGARERTVRMAAATRAEARAAALAILARLAQPKARVTSAVVDLSGQDAARAPMVGLLPSDLVTVRRHPLANGSAVTGSYHVEGLRHSVEGLRWRAQLTLTPVP